MKAEKELCYTHVSEVGFFESKGKFEGFLEKVKKVNSRGSKFP